MKLFFVRIGSRRAMTLIELVIVVAILAVLSTSAISYYQDYLQQARQAVTRENLKTAREAIAQYFKENLDGPASFTQLGLGNIETNILGKLDEDDILLGVVVPASSSFSGVSPNPYLATQVTTVYFNRGVVGNGQRFRDIKLSGPYSSW